MEIDELPQPRVFQEGKKLLMMMEYKGKKAYERIPLQFLKMNDMQKTWFLENLKIVPKLFKKLKIKNPNA